jgi:hypothetical protein
MANSLFTKIVKLTYKYKQDIDKVTGISLIPGTQDNNNRRCWEMCWQIVSGKCNKTGL